jgi:hypothetical protein
MNMTLKSVASNANKQQCAYRNLWLEVIRQAFYRACVGENAAVIWFTATGGMFSTLCLLLDLPEQKIRDQVLKRRKRGKQ